MNIQELLTPELLICKPECQSKKRALETIAKHLSSHQGLDANAVFTALLERERLGSTGLGKGIAIPHCHIKDLPRAYAVVMTLPQGIDFDAVDDQPVDVLVSLVVPDGQEQQHLETLASIVTMLQDDQQLQKIRAASSKEALSRALKPA